MHDPHATPLSTYRCAICMDSPTTATTTVCGHLFCHTCLKDSLKWSAQQRRDDAGMHGRRAPSAGSGLCPVCRKVLHDSEGSQKAGIVGLEIRKISRKDYERRKKQQKVDDERELFLQSLDDINTRTLGEDKGKAKQKGKSRDEDFLDDVVKLEDRTNDVGIARSRKRRRDDGSQYDNTEGF